MKKIIMILSVTFGLLISYSCSESLLELTPPTSQSSNDFYKTSEQFRQALNSAYTGMRNIALYGIFMDEMRSDNAFYTMYPADRAFYSSREKLSLFIDDEVSANASGVYSTIRGRWESDWSAISKANVILDRLDGSGLTDAEKNSVKAEALFLRAFYYFDLVKNWGGVPMYLHEVTNPSNAFIARSSVEETYAQIVSDLDEAISLGLPVPAKFPDDNGGRATMGAAKMLRAEVLMTKPSPDYAKAENDLKDITKMNYKLLEDYSSIFNPNNKNMEETILDVQYTEDGTSDQYSSFTKMLAPRCNNTADLFGVAGDNQTGRTSGGWMVPTKRMIDSYEDGDLRLPASIKVVEGHSDGDVFTFERLADVKNYVCPNGKDFRYMVIKYYHPPYKYNSNFVENFPVYRYAGALLLLAECLVQEGKATEALQYR